MTPTKVIAFCVACNRLLLLVVIQLSALILTVETSVNTTYGPVSGLLKTLPTNKTVVNYLGIPFARAQRFEYPVPPDKWTSTLHANETNSICPQPNLAQAKRPLMSEECLQLNLYVPGNITNASTLAVMLWFHGGAFIFGDTLGYDGSVLATEGGVIVVTAAYRLGVLGFLSANTGDLRGNYGLMDQIEAMKWVNKNIARFGGDPNKVTIFGGSSGGMCVALLMLSPLASGLYKNVIMQSGTAAALSSAMEMNEAHSRARSFADEIGCDVMNNLKACAKMKSLREILDAQLKVTSVPTLLPFGPVVDGYVLPDSPGKLLGAGKFNKTSVIIGVARDDGSIFMSGVPGVMKGVNVPNGMPRELFTEEISKRIWIRNQTTQIPELLIYQYTDWSNASDPYLLRQQFMDLHSDSVFKAPAILSADAFVKEEVPTYFYQLEKAPKVFPAIPFPLPPWFGIYHRADLLYVFGGPLIMAANLTTAAEIELSKSMMKMWTNFAKTGNPNNPIPLRHSWPKYTTDQGQYLALRPNITVNMKMRPEKMALWNTYLPNINQTVVEQLPAETTSLPPQPCTINMCGPDNWRTVLIILTVLFFVLAVIFLVLFVVTWCVWRRQRANYTDTIIMTTNM